MVKGRGRIGNENIQLEARATDLKAHTPISFLYIDVLLYVTLAHSNSDASITSNGCPDVTVAIQRQRVRHLDPKRSTDENRIENHERRPS